MKTLNCEEDARSENGEDRMDYSSEEERDLPDTRLLMLDELVATHQLEIRTRIHVPLRGGTCTRESWQRKNSGETKETET